MIQFSVNIISIVVVFGNRNSFPEPFQKKVSDNSYASDIAG
jgi:hypothetical protein